MTPQASESAFVAAAVAAFDAAGGKVTVCPPRYVGPVQGGQPLSADVPSADLRELRTDMHGRANKSAAERETASRRRQAMEEATRPATSPTLMSRTEGAKLASALRSAKAKVKLGNALRMIGDDWTVGHLRDVSVSVKMTYAKLRDFLRYHGHGGRLPNRQKVGRVAPAPIPAADIAARDKAIVSDYLDTNMAVADIEAKHGVSQRTIRRLAQASGKKREKMRVVLPRFDAPRDAEMADMYLAGTSQRDIAAHFHVTRNTVQAALERQGVDRRGNVEAQQVTARAKIAAERKAKTIAMHLAGKRNDVIAEALGYKSAASVRLILVHWRREQQPAKI